MKKNKHLIIICLLVILVFAIDLISKTIANTKLSVLTRNEVIDNFFYITLCYNTGGAWRIFSGHALLLALVSLVALSIVIYTMFKAKSKFYLYSCALFIGGLLGNLFDRIVYGKVIDFLDFIIFGYDFPIFNVADCFICIGVALMFISIIKEDKVYGKVSA